MRCCVCERRESRVGVLCESCREPLVGRIPITREQIRAADGVQTFAALVDVWGGAHRLCADTTIGRALEPAVFSVYDSSVSRAHARIVLGDHGWTIQDLGSVNGTYAGDRAATSPLPLARGMRIKIGFIKFYFVDDISTIRLPDTLEEMGQTARPSHPLELTTELDASPSREVTFKLLEPSGGGAGIVEIGGIPVHLTLAQYELIARLVQRRVSAPGPQEDAGFVSSEELAGVLSLDSLRPDDDNVRQLVRRVRRALQKAGLDDMIESRYRRGYRLTVTPRLV